MNPLGIVAFLSLITAVSSIADDVTGELIVDAPATWKVEFQDHQGLHMYFVNFDEGHSGMLSFTRLPVPRNADPKRIAEQIQELADDLVKIGKENENIKLSSEYEIGKIAGGAFSGSFVQFLNESGSVSVWFTIGEGEELWSGQFIGTTERWPEALNILKKLKRKAN